MASVLGGARLPRGALPALGEPRGGQAQGPKLGQRALYLWAEVRKVAFPLPRPKVRKRRASPLSRCVGPPNLPRPHALRPLQWGQGEGGERSLLCPRLQPWTEWTVHETPLGLPGTGSVCPEWRRRGGDTRGDKGKGKEGTRPWAASWAQKQQPVQSEGG